MIVASHLVYELPEVSIEIRNQVSILLIAHPHLHLSILLNYVIDLQKISGFDSTTKVMSSSRYLEFLLRPDRHQEDFNSYPNCKEPANVKFI